MNELHYPEIYRRQEQIHEAAGNSYRWAFDTWSVPLRSWLIDGSGVFWVSGKPGSGKSTFMKFISRHPETMVLLEKWANGRTLVAATHYFWYAGTSSHLERSREGMLLNLLYQISESLPKAVPIMLPQVWRKYCDDRERVVKMQDLVDGLRTLHCLTDSAFVLFVDGLDECYPPSDHSVLLDELETIGMQSNVKICVSSRPWKPFEPRLAASDFRLTMQDLTRRDMEDYIISELLRSARDAGVYEEFCGSNSVAAIGVERDMPHVHARTPDSNFDSDSPYSDGQSGISNHESSVPHDGHGKSLGISKSLNSLVTYIARQSEGVFLWVYLILRDLRDEIFAGVRLSSARR